MFNVIFNTMAYALKHVYISVWDQASECWSSMNSKQAGFPKQTETDPILITILFDN